MSSYLRVRQDKRKTNWYEINEWQTDRKRKTDRDFGSAWPRADKTINRSNPPPAYSPESHWPGPPCITKQRDTMRQKVRDRETDTERRDGGEQRNEKDGGEFLTPIPSFPSRHSFLHQHITLVRRPVTVRGHSGVSGPMLMLMSPTQSQQHNDVNTRRRTVMEKMIRAKMKMALIMSRFWWQWR